MLSHFRRKLEPLFLVRACDWICNPVKIRMKLLQLLHLLFDQRFEDGLLALEVHEFLLESLHSDQMLVESSEVHDCWEILSNAEEERWFTVVWKAAPVDEIRLMLLHASNKRRGVQSQPFLEIVLEFNDDLDFTFFNVASELFNLLDGLVDHKVNHVFAFD